MPTGHTGNIFSVNVSWDSHSNNASVASKCMVTRGEGRGEEGRGGEGRGGEGRGGEKLG